MATKPFKKQMHITLSEEAHQQLDDLRKTMGAGSIAEVIRNSLATTRYFERQRVEGKEIIIRDPKSNREKVIVALR